MICQKCGKPDSPHHECDDDWFYNAAKTLAPQVEETYEKDWQDLALCAVKSNDDLSFISKPDEVTEKRWAKICSRCEVIEQCYKWANRNDITGSFIAGEWRE
jgi:hypothetical protein